MWVLLLSSLLIVSANGLNLTGENVCEQEERYTVNVTQNVKKNSVVRMYVWCLNFPPRCSTYKIQTTYEKQIVEEERIRQVPICCEGYEPDPAGEKCVPQCKHCVNGVCDDEHKCYCHPGYRGDYCERGCEFARWGRYCRYHCTCERGECDPINGHCECPSGWTGSRCEQQCPSGYFGLQCKDECYCPEEEICNPSDGRCLSKDKYLEDMALSKSSTSRKHNPFGISTLNIRKPAPKPTASSERVDTKKIVGVYVLTTTESAEDIITTMSDNSIAETKSSTLSSKIDSRQPKFISDNITESAKIENNLKSSTESIMSITVPNKTTEKDLILKSIIYTTMPSITTITREIKNQQSISKKPTVNNKTTSAEKSKSTQEKDVITTSVYNYDTTTSKIIEQLSPSYHDSDIKTTITSQNVIPMLKSRDVLKKKSTSTNSMENETEAIVEVMKRNVLSEKKSSGDAFTRDKDEFRNSFNKSALIGIVSAAITICVLLVGAGLYTTARIKEKHRKQMQIQEACARDSHSKEYAFSTKSIFHFPLPDPPDHYNDNTIKRLDSNTTFKSNPAKTTESTYKTSIDYLELFYDQPPSRGTYRAASIPEPPSPKEDDIPQITVEPIYDEIPSWAENSSPVYANSNQEEVTKF